MNFKYSSNGLRNTEKFEACKLTAYRDSVGVLTIGYGHTGSDVIEGMTITHDQAEALLMCDVETASNAVNARVPEDCTQNEFDALVDFTFNCGAGNFDHSTLLKKLQAGDIEGAADEFLKWDRAGGQILAGLAKRRSAERTLFLLGQ
jgi:lysozyme